MNLIVMLVIVNVVMIQLQELLMELLVAMKTAGGAEKLLVESRGLLVDPQTFFPRIKKRNSVFRRQGGYRVVHSPQKRFSASSKKSRLRRENYYCFTHLYRLDRERISTAVMSLRAVCPTWVNFSKT